MVWLLELGVPEGYPETVLVLVEFVEVPWTSCPCPSCPCPSYLLAAGLINLPPDMFLACRHPGRRKLNPPPLEPACQPAHRSPVDSSDGFTEHNDQDHCTFWSKTFFRFLRGGAAAASARSFCIFSSCARQCLHVFWCRLKGPGFFHFSLHGCTQA